MSLLNIGRSLVGSSDWYKAQWQQLHILSDKPWQVLWGTKDGFITQEYLQKWKAKLPNAIVSEFNCGHFVQEEKAIETINQIDSFITAT